MTTTKLYAMPIIIKDGNFIGFVSRPFTRSEMRMSLQSLGFTKDDADCWDADPPTEYEIPAGFDPEAEAKTVIHLSGSDQRVFLVDVDEVDTWSQRQVTYEEIASQHKSATSPRGQGLCDGLRRRQGPRMRGGRKCG